jgi:hypothetical protein
MLGFIVFGGILLLLVGAYFALDSLLAGRMTKRSLGSGADPRGKGEDISASTAEFRMGPPPVRRYDDK